MDTYSPVTMIRDDKSRACRAGKNNQPGIFGLTLSVGGGHPEDYKPTSVDTFLGNPRVRLVRAGKPVEFIKTAPTAADIARLGPAYHMDLPGDPLDPGCTYANDFAALEAAGKARLVTYAHIATEPGRPGFAVQYWFFYYFNQFNDLHEGDWEGMQVTFDASTPAQALARGPDKIALFQHGGGQKLDWRNWRVQRAGTHPMVYVAAGSHATFFEPAVYVENGGGGSGLGCDVATEPLDRLHPSPVIVPTHPRPGSRFEWLNSQAHWGQKEKGFNNGPQGPATKTQWLKPFTWMESAKLTNPKLPGGVVLGSPVTNAFCGTVTVLSHFVNLESRSRVAVILIGLVAALVIGLPLVLTSWRPVDLTRLRLRRAFGQLLRATRQLYGRHWRTLVPLGFTATPIIAAVYGIEWVLREAPGKTAFTAWLSSSLASIGRSIGLAVVAAVVITFLRQLDDERPVGVVGGYRGMSERFWRVVLGQLLAALTTAVIALTVIGIPFAIWKYVEWQFVQQEILFEDKTVWEAFRGSTRLVRGQWWRTVRVAGYLWLLSVVTGPVLGFLLIFANLPLVLIDAVGSIVFALLIPYVAIGRTLMYFDLADRREEVARTRVGRRRFWQRTQPSPQPG